MIGTGKIFSIQLEPRFGKPLVEGVQFCGEKVLLSGSIFWL